MDSKPLILTVDRNQRNLELLAQILGKEGYDTLSANTLEGIDQILERGDPIGVALVDISGFDRQIWAYCEKLSDNGVPLLVISPQKLAGIGQESRSHGAQDVLFKPLVIKELMGIIRSLFRGNAYE